MADLIILPVIALILINSKHIIFDKNYKDKQIRVYDDYLNQDRSTVLKGVCAISIVLLHLGSVTDSRVLPQVSAFAVSIFFFLSGYGLVCQYLRKGTNYLNGFLYKRVIKIVIPYLIAATLYSLYFYYAKLKYDYVFYGEYNFGIKGVLKAFLEHGYTIVINSWFVIVLLIVYIAFYFCFKYLKDIKDAICVLSSFVVLLTIVFFVLAQYRGWMTAYYMQTLSIICGLVFAYKKDKIDRLLNKYSLEICSVLVILSFSIALAFTYLKFNLAEIGGMFDTAQYIVMAPLIPVCVVIANSRFKIGCNNIWKFIGKISFEIYLIHGLFYYAFQMGPIVIKNDLLKALAVILSSVICAYFLNVIGNFVIKLLLKISVGKK